MRDQANPFLAAYDQDAWVTERNYAAADPDLALAAFKDLRARHLSELAALSPADRDRPGRHEEQGQITILSHTIHIASHDLNHTAQLARLAHTGG